MVGGKARITLRYRWAVFGILAFAYFWVYFHRVSTAALNIFPFAGGAVLQQMTGLMLTARSLESYQSIWLFMLACVIVACAAALLSLEEHNALSGA